MIVVSQGLRITTSCRYMKFTESRYLKIYEDKETSCIHIEFPRDLKTDRIIDKRIEVLNPGYLRTTDYIKLTNTKFELNGVKFIKTVQHDYVFSQYIVKKEVNFMMRFNENSCEIIIPEILYYRFDKYLELLSKNPYIKVVDSSHFTKFCNFYSINIGKRDVRFNSNNEFEFNTKKVYTAYLLNSIDILQSFKNRMEMILGERGIEYVRHPIDEKASTVDRVIWRVTEMDHQISHKTGDYPLRHSIIQSMHLEFKLSTPNLAILDDFRTRYANKDILTNFTTFDTKDKVGMNWKSNIWWSPIGYQFNQDYSTDEQQNYAQEAEFNCDIQYYTVYDDTYLRINKVILDMQNMNDNSTYDIVTI